MFEQEFASVPANPPRTGMLPGMRIKSAIPRSTLVLLLALVALFALMPLSMLSMDPRARLQFGPSATAQGRVLSLADASGCRGSDARSIVYSFSSEPGKEFRGVAVVCDGAPYYSVSVGDTIPVRYLERDPAVNNIAGGGSNEPPIFLFMIFPLLFVLIFSPLYFPQLREVMRARKLYKRGTLIQGQVVFVTKRNTATWPGWPGSSTADVYVSYPSQSGARTETVVWCANDWLINQLVPGAPVHVLLPPGGSTKGALLEAFIR
ncbi:MAG: hypothetical protein JSR67_06780 [Proteobacteria bacterium]|nr:hypothetical protein [Pseudomonadota bacterium]